MTPSFIKPTKQELQDAYGATIPDVIAPELKVLFVGINPSLYSGATGFHFARPGNRFWPALHESGFTDRLLHPSESEELLARGLGVTNLVARATTAATELTDAEIALSARRLRTMAGRYRPGWIAFLGIGAYRIAFRDKRATIGEQAGRIGGSGVWVLPNPSGLNAHYQLPDLARLFSELRMAAGIG